MVIVDKGKILILRRMYDVTNFPDNVNYFVFGTAFDQNYYNEATSGLKNQVFASKITNLSLNQTVKPYYIEFITSIDENSASMPGGFSASLNEVGLAYLSGATAQYISGVQLTRLVSYGPIHVIPLQQGGGAIYTVRVRIYYL